MSPFDTIKKICAMLSFLIEGFVFLLKENMRTVKMKKTPLEYARLA